MVKTLCGIGSKFAAVIVFYVCKDKAHCTGHVGRCHRRAAVFSPAVGNGRNNFAAVGGNFGFELKVGCGTPAGEVGHEGACHVSLAYIHCARACLYEAVGRIHCYRAGRHGVGEITKAHADNARYVIVYHAADSSVLHCNTYLIFERYVAATTDDCNFAGYIYVAGVVYRHAVAGYYLILNGIYILTISLLFFRLNARTRQ